MTNYLIWDFDDTLGYRAGGKWTASLVKVLQIEMPDFPVEVEANRTAWSHFRSMTWQNSTMTNEVRST